MDTFTASANERHSTELAMLQGARLVTASETQAGKRWDEARVKSLTGSDPITARFMRQDFFTYTPQFKLLFTGNHKPELRNVDDAVKRRVHFVPFVVKPATVDRDLEEKLRAEWPAILSWLIKGCLAWQRDGLNPPQAVRATTEEYFRDEDAVGQWLDETCEESPDGFTALDELFDSWRERCGRLGIAAGSVRQF
jgi:putative DNA primase/helicase